MQAAGRVQGAEEIAGGFGKVGGRVWADMKDKGFFGKERKSH